ncbi:restriction endonuclease subunit S [Peribacillus frigoritolerans]|uniref:restriction endonuclease subunit S n=1 Tax=Peribacillus frigoritolerans TaxID=450367 RepID=UPI0022266034|nr:restriction endonuclease subunit S [Peribacillus frigoritolerans]UYY97943.1 restriction endonuclease subunit S [Peribacillus frigoritolerans]
MKNNRKPEIRFPGFTGDWEQRKLGEVYTERKERGYDSLQILSVSIHHGVSNKELDSDTLGKKVRRSEDKSLYKHVYFGDLVFNMMRAWQGAIGVVKSEGMVSPAYITAIPSAQIYPPFMDYSLRRDEMINQMDNLSYGVTDFRKRLYWDSFINVLCRIPSVPEQERITTFFTRLNNTIALYQQELTTLKQTKQGFLQKMFPNEGESKPEIRFPGFTGDWKLHKLGELLKKQIKGKAKLDNLNSGDVEYLDANRLNGGHPFLCDADKDVNKDDILILWDGSKAGTVYQGFEGALGSTFKAYSVIDKINSSFIYQWLVLAQEKIYREYRTPNIPHVVKNFTEIFDVKVPTIEEQIIIGNFLKQLDETIALHHCELDALKETKKAFLQKMIV